MNEVLNKRLPKVYEKYGLKKGEGKRFLHNLFSAVGQYIVRCSPMVGNLPEFYIPYFGRFKPIPEKNFHNAYKKYEDVRKKYDNFAKKQRLKIKEKEVHKWISSSENSTQKDT